MAVRRLQRLQRLKDQKKRDAIPYKVRLLLGIAPELASDTIIEKVLKKFPGWYNDLIHDVVDMEWDHCDELLTEQENFLQLEESKIGKFGSFMEQVNLLSLRN